MRCSVQYINQYFDSFNCRTSPLFPTPLAPPRVLGEGVTSCPFFRPFIPCCLASVSGLCQVVAQGERAVGKEKVLSDWCPRKMRWAQKMFKADSLFHEYLSVFFRASPGASLRQLLAATPVPYCSLYFGVCWRWDSTVSTVSAPNRSSSQKPFFHLISDFFLLLYFLRESKGLREWNWFRGISLVNHTHGDVSLISVETVILTSLNIEGYGFLWFIKSLPIFFSLFNFN